MRALSLALLCTIGALAQTATNVIVVPNANATVAGNDNSGFPQNFFLSAEFQTVVDPDQFPTGPIYITGLSFRAAPGLGPLALTGSASLYLSTSPNYANSNGHPLLSTTFANNVGPDNTLVFSGNFTFNGPACAAPGPCPFASGIAFTAPFLYNPAKGPLLIDTKATSIGVSSGQIDVQDCNLATTCSVAGINAEPLGTPTAIKGVGASGTVMQISYVPASSAGSTSNVTLNLTQTNQTHTVPYINTFAETGSVGALGNATLFMTSNLTITSSAAVVPPIPLTAVLYFDQLDSIDISYSENDVNFASEPTFTLSGATITGGTGAWAGATGSLNLTFTQGANNVYTTTGTGSVAVPSLACSCLVTTPLTLTNFQGSGGNCTACSLEYNNIDYSGTAAPLGNATLTSTIDVTNSPPLAKVLFGTVSVNNTDSFNIFTSYPSPGASPTSLTVSGGTGAYAGATGSFSVTQFSQNSAGSIVLQGTGTVTTAATGAPVITSVITASGAPVIADNTWLQINGANLAPANTPASGVVWSNAPSFNQGQMPTQLGPISVTVDGMPAYIYFYCSAATDTSCASDQINVLSPLNTSSAQYPVQVVVTNNGVSSAPFTVLNNGLSPAFPIFDVQGHVAARHLNYSLVGPTSLYPGSTTPAMPGETIILVAFGLGMPSGTAPVAGSATQSGSLPATPQCWISGFPATVVGGAALISPGLYQINVTVPTQATSGDNPITCNYQGYPTFPGALIAVQ